VSSEAADGRLRPADEQETLRLMRRVAVVMFLVGGAVCLSGVWITQVERSGQVAQGAIALSLLASGLVLAVLPVGRRWWYEAAVLWAIPHVSMIIALGRPFGMAPFFYLWPVVYSAYFSSRRLLVVSYVVMVVTMGAGLAVNPTADLKVDTFVGTASTVGLMAALVATLTRQEKQLRDELAVAAETDPLTGLLNRRSFNPRFGALIEEAARWRRPLSVVMFDIDHFKMLNDEWGHHVGDLALQQLSAVLRAESRDLDLVARYGGEEFAVVLPGADLESARAYTERVAGSLRAVETHGYTLSVSAGIAGLCSGRTDPDELLVLADEALYAAKEAGRCRPATWTGEVVVGRPFGDTASV
jgi:diguanylate cyclase (GGDEF)-like protein